jgi:hypothetical protein
MLHELGKVDSREVYDGDTLCGCDIDVQCAAHVELYTSSERCGCNADKACEACIDDGIYTRPDTIMRNTAFYNVIARMNGYHDAEQLRYYEFTIP